MITNTGRTTTPGTITRTRLVEIVASASPMLFALAGCGTEPKPAIVTPIVLPTTITILAFTATPIVIFQTVIVTATPTPEATSDGIGDDVIPRAVGSGGSTRSDPSLNSHHNRDNGTAVHLNRNPASHAHVFANIDRPANAHRVATNTSVHAGTDCLSSTTTPALPTPPLATSTPPVATASVLAGATAAIGFDPFGPDKNCGEFEDWASANAFFIAAGGPGDDPHGLNGNDDGVPCQSLPGAP